MTFTLSPFPVNQKQREIKKIFRRRSELHAEDEMKKDACRILKVEDRRWISKRLRKNIKCIQESTGRYQRIKQKMKGEDWKFVKNIKEGDQRCIQHLIRKEEDPR